MKPVKVGIDQTRGMLKYLNEGCQIGDVAAKILLEVIVTIRAIKIAEVNKVEISGQEDKSGPKGAIGQYSLRHCGSARPTFL